MKSFLRLMLLGLVLIMVALASALTAMRFAIHGREVAVPKLVGLTPVQAQKLLTSKGLVLETERRFYSADVPEGQVMSQMPEAGTLVRRGWRVRIAESMGPQRVVIPDMLGQSGRAAEMNIRRSGLELGTIAAVNIPDLPPNQVVAQSPPPNASGVASPRISLLETTSAQASAFVMPDFVGQRLLVAKQEVQSAGLMMGNVTEFPPASNSTTTPTAQPIVQPVSPGQAPASAISQLPVSQFSTAALIVGQDPPAGQKVTTGTVVNFQVNQ